MKARSPVAFTLLCLVGFLLLFNLGGWPLKIRFAAPSMNYWFVALLSIAVPISLALAAMTFQRRALKAVGIAVAAIATLPALLFSTFAAFEAVKIGKEGRDASYQLLGDISHGRYTYRLYLTNCGATCAYGLDLRRELDSSVGLKLVWPVWSKYRTEPSAELRLVDGVIQIIENGVVIGSVET